MNWIRNLDFLLTGEHKEMCNHRERNSVWIPRLLEYSFDFCRRSFCNEAEWTHSKGDRVHAFDDHSFVWIRDPNILLTCLVETLQLVELISENTIMFSSSMLFSVFLIWYSGYIFSVYMNKQQFTEVQNHILYYDFKKMLIYSSEHFVQFTKYEIVIISVM